MRILWIGLGITAVASVVACHNSSPQVDQTQTSGAPAANANSSGNGSGDNSESAHPKGQLANTNGNVPGNAKLAPSAEPPIGTPIYDNSGRGQKFDGGR